MIGILSRQEFKDTVAKFFKTDGDYLRVQDNSPLWIPESPAANQGRQITCNYFICVNRMQPNTTEEDYWFWVTNNLKGYVRCFVSDPDNGGEYWGFTEQEDIVPWLLKWVK